MNCRPLRRLFFDIETSPNVVLSWRIGYKINLSHENILNERAIICIGYKWEGEDKLHALHWDKDQSDKALLERFIKIAGEADELVAHNGDKFDLPWIKTRCIFHGLPTMPDYKTIDTLQWSRRKFYFNSNRLDYIARFLGIGAKIKTEFNLWREVLKNNQAAMNSMVTYCKQDVALLEKVWHRLAQHVNAKTHAGVAAGLEAWTCPRTGSTHVKKSQTKVTARGVRQHQMKNLETGTYYTISDKAFRDYQEAKKQTAGRPQAAKPRNKAA